MTFAPEFVSPLKLPSLPLDWRKGFPSCPAIYFAIADDKILYIGRATKLSNRWTKHHRLAELQEIKEVRIAWMEVSDSKLLPTIEKALIQYFKPLLNNRLVKVRKPKAKRRGNPQNFNNPPKTSIAPLSFRLTDKQIDEFVRSLPNRNEWLREVVSVAAQQEMAANHEQSA